MFRSGWEYSEAGRHRMKKAACWQRVPDAAVRLQQSGFGSMTRGEPGHGTGPGADGRGRCARPDVGVLMNAELRMTPMSLAAALRPGAVRKENMRSSRGIRADVSQEAAIFKCNAENRSIIETRVSGSAQPPRSAPSGLPVQTGEKGDYLYIAIGADAVWMRNYLKGL